MKDKKTDITAMTPATWEEIISTVICGDCWYCAYNVMTNKHECWRGIHACPLCSSASKGKKTTGRIEQ